MPTGPFASVVPKISFKCSFLSSVVPVLPCGILSLSSGYYRLQVEVKIAIKAKQKNQFEKRGGKDLPAQMSR
jgi:hypothetical protein